MLKWTVTAAEVQYYCSSMGGKEWLGWKMAREEREVGGSPYTYNTIPWKITIAIKYYFTAVILMLRNLHSQLGDYEID